MSDEPTERDVEALAAVITAARRVTPNGLARAVLASDWYAERIAQGRAAAAEAWDEGFQAACDETPMGYAPDGPNRESGNPYRGDA